ncbi:MAG: nitroreductase family deazaflavin-dependent oxidoreductase [Anaerolineales bacterium]|jgi:deazaflavin-dependent oxidoreductase (nitroreductase family)
MIEKAAERTPPTGIKRAFFRAPIWLYRINLGWLLGSRFLKLTHTGRISGQPRQVVLEVVMHDAPNNIYYVAAAWGEKSDWVKNIRTNPEVEVQVGRQNFSMLAEELSPGQSELVILDYAQRHPTAMISLARYMGYELDGTESDYRELGRKLLMFSFTPRSSGPHQ